MTAFRLQKGCGSRAKNRAIFVYKTALKSADLYTLFANFAKKVQKNPVSLSYFDILRMWGASAKQSAVRIPRSDRKGYGAVRSQSKGAVKTQVG